LAPRYRPAKDFADHEEKAATFAASLNNGVALKSDFDGHPAGGEGDWFLMLYRKWRHAFEMAADNGIVELH